MASSQDLDADLEELYRDVDLSQSIDGTLRPQIGGELSIMHGRGLIKCLEVLLMGKGQSSCITAPRSFAPRMVRVPTMT